ncbi:UvrD-helicase domain-containing protein [Clostridium saccharobutylicum]|uniref:UvrD-helicase domain-containing protein n=1 Tax=Clostridium saccharobutylicum TaxID=169679 RepID=UPI00156E556B|nr:DNA helicase-2/ATP-dependent DNA helicase PcrA [Clostridium saccharobutylicum]
MGYNLDKYQMSAIKCEDRNALIVAAPGSGKTTVIINKVDHLVSDKKVSNGNIIIITFTKAAAENMKKRYAQIVSEKRFLQMSNVNRSPFFGTFHGLFYKMLLKCGKKIDIIDGGIAHKIVSNVLSKYFDDVNDDKVKEAINNISLYKTSRADISTFKPSLAKEIFEKCLEKYEEYKREYNKYDFDDLAIEVLDLLRKNKNILLGYRKLFKYILVDEFQDCDEMQIDFLKLINDGDNNSLFAVGDEDQCIYSFRGSKPEYMVSFQKIFNEGKKYYLYVNYRSRMNIVNKSKDVIKFNKERNNKEIKSNKDSEGIIRWFNSYNEKMQAESLVDIIMQNKNLNIPYEDNAVLYRTNVESMTVIDVLTKRKIPFTLLDREYNFFEHFICRDLIAYLRLAINQFDRESFLKIINKPFRYISKSNLSFIKNYVKEENPFDIIMGKEDMPPFQRKKLDELKKDINYLNKISLSSAIAYIIMDLGYIDYLKSYAEKSKQSLDDFEDVIEEFKLAAEGYKTIFEFLGHIEEVKQSIEESKSKTKKEGVILSTIHGVKGMEFKNVYIINCVEETIPHANSIKENLEEERRLFYVAITRAIDNLYLFSPRSRKGQFKDISRFIIEGKLNDMPVDTYGYEVGDKVAHRTYGIGEIEEFNEEDKDKIKLKFSDGTFRSFSLKVLIDNNLIQKVE